MYHLLNSRKQEIRIITIAPAANLDQPPVCSLQTVSLSENPYYGALSYVWGDPNDKTPIEVEGQTFQATRNLDTALRFLRSKSIKTLWVDAICINQNDLSERSSQVSLMLRIYQTARNVHVWLGEFTPNWWNEFQDDDYKARNFLHNAEAQGGLSDFEFEDSFSEMVLHGTDLIDLEEDKFCAADADLDDFRLLLRHFEEYGETKWAKILLRRSNGKEGGKEIISIHNKWYSGMGVLRWLLSRPWWTRVWTLQEAVAANSAPLLHVGCRLVAFGDLIATFKILEGYTTTMSFQTVRAKSLVSCGSSIAVLYRRTIAPILSLRDSSSTDRVGLWYTMIASRSRGATDPRDRYYGVLGLLPPTLNVKVDYTIGFQELCCRATKMALMSARPRNIKNWLLFAVGTGEGNHPTWATDFQFGRDNTVIYEPSEDDFDSSAISADPDSRILRIRAAKICRIDFAADGYTDSPVHSIDAVLCAKNHIDNCQKACEQYGIQANSPTFWRTFFCDRAVRTALGAWNFAGGYGQMNDGQAQLFGQVLQNILSIPPFDRLLKQDREYRTSKVEEIERQMTRLHGPVAYSLQHWQFFCCKGGNLGSGRPGVKVGDEVFVIHGCGLPVILRRIEGPKENGEMVYNLVGECYVDGWMDGSKSKIETEWKEVILA